MFVYLVVFSNYIPSEVESIWSTHELAHSRAEKLESDDIEADWRVEKWEIDDDAKNSQEPKK